MSDKTWGRTVLGWFVTRDDQPEKPADDAEALINKYAETPPPAPHPVDFKGPLPAVPADGALDFAPVFEAAGIAREEQERVGKAQALLRSLPADTPAPAKKQIVEASLKAFSVPTERIIEAAVGEVQALEGFIRAGQQETQRQLAEANQRIAGFESEIAALKQAMEDAVKQQEARARAANAEKLHVQEVLEFFGQETVARVVHDSPKLHEPA